VPPAAARRARPAAARLRLGAARVSGGGGIEGQNAGIMAAITSPAEKRFDQLGHPQGLQGQRSSGRGPRRRSGCEKRVGPDWIEGGRSGFQSWAGNQGRGLGSGAAAKPSRRRSARACRAQPRSAAATGRPRPRAQTDQPGGTIECATFGRSRACGRRCRQRRRGLQAAGASITAVSRAAWRAVAISCSLRWPTAPAWGRVPGPGACSCHPSASAAGRWRRDRRSAGGCGGPQLGPGLQPGIPCRFQASPAGDRHGPAGARSARGIGAA